MQITAAIFDVGSVLLAWSPQALYRRHFPKLSQSEIEAFLREVDFAEWNLQQDRGRPFSEGVAELSERFPHRSPLIRAYHEHWADSILGPIPGTIEIARALKKDGLGIYALTNFSAETFAVARKAYPFFAEFDDIVVSGEVGIVKPDPEIFDLTLKRIGCPAPECVFIDDAPKNIEVARHLGFAAIQFQDAVQLEHDLRSMGLMQPH